MNEQLVSQYALHWAAGFLVIYVLMQLLISKHPRFQTWSAMRKSMAVKIFSLLGFIVLYGLAKMIAS